MRPGLGFLAGENRAAEGTLQQPLPEPAAGAGIGNGLGDEPAQRMCTLGQLAEVGGQAEPRDGS